MSELTFLAFCIIVLAFCITVIALAAIANGKDRVTEKAVSALSQIAGNFMPIFEKTFSRHKVRKNPRYNKNMVTTQPKVLSAPPPGDKSPG